MAKEMIRSVIGDVTRIKEDFAEDLGGILFTSLISMSQKHTRQSLERLILAAIKKLKIKHHGNNLAAIKMKMTETFQQ